MPPSLERNLPARHYVDPAIHERERQAIFRRSWQMLGPESQVAAPGDSALGSYRARYSWNPAVLRYDSAGAGTFGVPTVNADSASIGVLVFAGVDADPLKGPLVLARLWFTAVSTGADTPVLEITEMSGVSPLFIDFFSTNRVVTATGVARVIP